MASASTAVAMLGLHRLKQVDARSVVAHFSGLASLTIALVIVFVRPISQSLQDVDLAAAALLLGVGLSGTLGQVFLTKAYAAGAPSKIAVLSLTQVAFGLGFDLFLYGRRLTLLSGLGFLMVVGPTAWVTTRAARRLRRSAGARGEAPGRGEDVAAGGDAAGRPAIPGPPVPERGVWS